MDEALSELFRIIQNEPLAQSVEHLTFNQRVGGSSPPWLTCNAEVVQW